MKKIILILSIALVFASCEKETTEPATGTLIVKNNSNNPYSLVIDGGGNNITGQSIPGKSSKTFQLDAGSYDITATQQSGYLVSPSIFTYNAILKENQTINFEFP